MKFSVYRSQIRAVGSRKRLLMREIESLRVSQLYHSKRDNWRLVVDLDILLEARRRELYGDDYYGF